MKRLMFLTPLLTLAAGEKLPAETEYRVEGDTLTWDSGENRMVLTRKQ